MRKPIKPQKFDNVIHTLMNFADENPEWHEYFESDFDLIISAVIADLDIKQGRFVALMQKTPHWTILFRYIFEHFAAKPRDDEGYTFIDDYLAQQPRRETRAHRRYLEAMNNTEVRMWEVIDVKQGTYASVRPYGSADEPIRIEEQDITQRLHRWDCVAARIIQLDERYLFTGVILPVPIEDAIHIHRARDSMLDKVTQTIHEAHQQGIIDSLPEDMEQASIAKMQDIIPILLFKTWTENQYETLTAEPPEIKNDDDEIYQPAKVRFPLNDTHDDIVDILDKHPELSKTADKQPRRWDWMPNKATATAEHPIRHLGEITLRKKALELKVNSRERAKKGEQWLQDILQKRVKPAMIIYDNPEDIQAKLAETPEEDFSPNDDDMRDAVNSHMDHYCRERLDEPSALLKDQTPRSCIGDPAMRQRLIEWAKMLENRTLRIPLPGYDFTWLWEELGVQDYR